MLDWNTPDRELMHQCGWLSVHQLAMYHSVVLVYKVMKTESPRYLFAMFSTKYNCDTRHAKRGLLRHTREFDLDLSEDSFRGRAARAFNDIPLLIKQKSTIKDFKIAVKKCIKVNIPLG